jgi:heat shock protein HslJ/membrane-bound inhibitor of C-type lysozyme
MRKIFVPRLSDIFKNKECCVMTKKFLKFGLVPLLLLVLTGSAWSAGNDEISVVLGDKVYIMERVPAESGEKYEAPDDHLTTFRISGTKSVLTIEGEECDRYVLLRKPHGGPQNRLIVTVDGVNHTLRQVKTASGAKYEKRNEPETYLWTKGNSATLCIDGNHYRGYDYWLPFGEIWIPGQSIPIGVEWKVVSINGEDVITDSAVTVTFRTDGKVSGTASVNNYVFPWMTYGNKIIISDGALTRKAGLPDMMEQENRFLEFLRGTVRYVVQRDTLRLINKNGGEIVLTR